MHDNTVMDAPEILARYRDADGTVPPHVCLTLLTRYATGQPGEGEARVTALEALAAAHHLATAAREVYGPLVAAAQAEGASWADIGAALGISRQAAHTTYRHATKEPSSMLSLFRRPAPAPAEEQVADLQEQVRDLQEQIRDLQQTIARAAHSQMSTTDLVTASLTDLSARITELEDAQRQPAPEPVAEEEDEMLRDRRDRVIQHHISQSVAYGGKPSPEHIALAQAVPLLPLEHFDPEVSYHHGSGEQYWLINGRQCDYGGALDQLMHVHGLTREEARALLDSCRR